MLEDSNCWRVSGVRTAEKFFRVVSLLVPDATHMFLEGSPDPDIEALLADAADEADYTAPVGTIRAWPQTDRRFLCERRQSSFSACRRRRRIVPNLKSAVISISIETKKLWFNGLMLSQTRFLFRKPLLATGWSVSSRQLAVPNLA